MSGVLVVVHPDRPQARSLASTAATWWQERGYDVVTSADKEPEPGGHPEPAAPELDGKGPFDFAISLGGDGTMLRAVRLACPGHTPVLGVNLGRMGYLTEVEPAGMLAAFEQIAAGKYQVEERMTLEVAVDAHATGGRQEYVALNEAIIEKIGPGHTIRVAVDISSRRFLTYAADGVLVCTPTGSTAYNLSARGPVVSPKLNAMVLTPVAPHLVFDRSLVLGPSETITFTLLGDREATVALDGSRIIPLKVGETVTCRGGEDPARLVTFSERDFHAVLRSRFGLTDH